MVAAEYPARFANSSRVRSSAFRLSFSQRPKECSSIAFALTKNVTLFVTLFVTSAKEGFATLRAQRPIGVSENIITSLTRIGGTMKKLLVSLGMAVLLLVVLASIAYAATGVSDPVVLQQLAQVRR